MHPASDLVRRRFRTSAPNLVWVADFTYWPTDEGFVYVAAVMDLFSRMIVGWAMSSHLRAEFVIDAIGMATARRDPAPGLIHHSDQGTQGGFKGGPLESAQSPNQTS
jgi:putative transposase